MGFGLSYVIVRLVLVCVIVVVRTSVDVETGSLQPNQPGSLHVLVVCFGPFEVVDAGGGEMGLVCGGDVGLGAESSLHPHHPGVAQ